LGYKRGTALSGATAHPAIPARGPRVRATAPVAGLALDGRQTLQSVRIPWARALIPPKYLPTFDRILNGAMLGLIVGVVFIGLPIFAINGKPLDGLLGYAVFGIVVACAVTGARINLRRKNLSPARSRAHKGHRPGTGLEDPAVGL
jgi:hypothetical protein